MKKKHKDAITHQDTLKRGVQEKKEETEKVKKNVNELEGKLKEALEKMMSNKNEFE